VVDHVLDGGSEAVIEWTMFSRPAGAGPGARGATRGAEWFVFRDGLIVEIRSYYQQRPQTSELHGFPYASAASRSSAPSAAACTSPPWSRDGPDRSRPLALGCSVPATIRCLTA
jgi:hypothetical protein